MMCALVTLRARHPCPRHQTDADMPRNRRRRVARVARQAPTCPPTCADCRPTDPDVSPDRRRRVARQMPTCRPTGTDVSPDRRRRVARQAPTCRQTDDDNVARQTPTMSLARVAACLCRCLSVFVVSPDMSVRQIETCRDLSVLVSIAITNRSSGRRLGGCVPVGSATQIEAKTIFDA